jgi:hypothetical protein
VEKNVGLLSYLHLTPYVKEFSYRLAMFIEITVVSNGIVLAKKKKQKTSNGSKQMTCEKG